MTDNITVFTQSSIKIAAGEGICYFDPIEIPEEFHDADVVFVTHDHYDHFSPEDIQKIAKKDTVLVVPAKMADQAEVLKDAVGEILAVDVFGSYEARGIAFGTLPSYNRMKPFHPKKAGWVGYVATLDGERIYVAGDTDVTEENKAVKCDIALVPVGGKYTMDAKQAAELVNIIKPKIAIPTHYGSIVGKATDGEDFAALVKEPVEVVFKIGK